MAEYLKLEADVKRLSELAGANAPSPEVSEAVGIAIGLLGLVVISLVRIADALEARS